MDGMTDVSSMVSETHRVGMTPTFQTVEKANESFRNMLSPNQCKGQRGGNNLSQDNYVPCEEAERILCRVTDEGFLKHHYGSQLRYSRVMLDAE